MTERVFVAREGELAGLQRFLDSAFSGHGQVCFVAGEAGSGKTALVTEFARRAEESRTDLLVAIGNCNAQSGIGDPYLPFREVLALLTGDVEAKLARGAISRETADRLRGFLRVSGEALVELGPDLINLFVPGAGLVTRAAAFAADQAGWLAKLERLMERKAAEPVDAGLEQTRIFEQYTNVLKALAAQRPLVLVVDDLHWADASSIGLLFHLGRRIEGSRILAVGMYRPEEVALGREEERHPLDKVLSELKRYYGDISLDLDKARETEGLRFVEALLDTESNQLRAGFRQALFNHTGGHPLFTIELMRDLQEKGDIVQDEQGRWIEGSELDWETLPPRVEGVIEERIGRLEAELRDTLSAASVEGENFTAQVIARVQEIRERQLLRRLSGELEKRHRLVTERGEVKLGGQFLSRFQFAHALFQQYLYNDLGAGERRLLHGEIGRVLEELYEGHTEEITPQLAHHFAEAAEGEKAIGYLLEAGDRARMVYAQTEAIDYYQRALVFLREQGEPERAARTLMKLGLTYDTAFDFRRARRAYDEGFALWQRAGQIQPRVPRSPAPHALRVSWLDMRTLDPTMATDSMSGCVIDQLFSGLVELSPEMGVVPDVVRSWEVLDGGREYVFHLRDDVRWSDGKPVTAGDFEFAWKRALDPATGPGPAYALYYIKGAEAFHLGEVSDPDSVGARSLDEVTLKVVLEEPIGFLLHLLTDTAYYPVPREAVQTYGEAWAEVENIVTNGPFRLAAWQRGESALLVRNPEYHGHFGGNLQQAVLSLHDDPIGQMEKYEADGLDVTQLWDLPLPEWDRVRQRHTDEYITGPAQGTCFLAFDVSRPPFDDARVRRALALAIDRETLADVVTRGYYSPATGGFVPPTMPGHSPGIGLPHDPEGARQLLAEAGYSTGRGFPTVDLLLYRAFTESVGEYLQAQWRENLGIEIRCETVELSLFRNRLDGESPHILVDEYEVSCPDPDWVLKANVIHSYGGWTPPNSYDTLMEEARRIADPEERMRLYGQADRVLVEEAAILPLTYDRLHLLVKPWVTKFPIGPHWHWFLKDVIIEPH
jgi:ABC-type oligopeptide transport system substrate-binding subunit